MGPRHLRRPADRAAADRDQEKIELVRQLVQAHAYWRIKGLAVDLVIWNEDPSGYRQVLQDQIMGLIAAGTEAQLVDRPGGIFVRRPEQMSDEDRTLLQTVARVIIDDSSGTLADRSSAAAAPSRACRGFSSARDRPRRVERRRPRRPAATWPTSTASADSPATATNTSSPPAAAASRPPPGSMCWPTPSSAPSSPKAAAPTPGAKTPTSSG